MDIWLLIFWVVLAASVCFALPVFIGAPYVPTLTRQAHVALELLDLQPGELMVELGCGDGKVVVMAARKGWRVVGYEINPILAAVAWLRTLPYRTHVKIICGNYARHVLPEETKGVYCFGMPRHMDTIHTQLHRQLGGKRVRLVSFAFHVPDEKILAQHDSVFLYVLR